jgi:lipid II:glycine glycyltransferase (peptidoglycan interpeptide bridge formation enzyme)
MALFHKKTRNGIRKALKSGIEIDHSDSLDALEALAGIHKKNIQAIGGLHKPFSVFKAIRDTFRYDGDYRVYLAQKEGQIIGALLAFFYNRTAEYFTPAVEEAYRSDQVGSLLAFVAMQEAVRRGCGHWNWGGTWKTQEGVYRFKSRFGAKDWEYTYYIREFDPSLRQLGREDVLAAYPYFYVLPFGILEHKCA